jgi:hypothetical protein
MANGLGCFHYGLHIVRLIRVFRLTEVWNRNNRTKFGSWDARTEQEPKPIGSVSSVSVPGSFGSVSVIRFFVPRLSLARCDPHHDVYFGQGSPPTGKRPICTEAPRQLPNPTPTIYPSVPQPSRRAGSRWSAISPATWLTSQYHSLFPYIFLFIFSCIFVFPYTTGLLCYFTSNRITLE